MHSVITLFISAVLPVGSIFAPISNGMLCAGIGTIHEDVETFSQTYEVSRGAHLTIENENGGISVSVWDEDVIDVHAEKKTKHGAAELQKVEIEVDIDQEIAIRTKYLEKNARVSVHYTIKVPKHIVVGHVRTSNGSIELKDVKGDVVVTTSNGDVEVCCLDGELTVTTSNGSITVKDAPNLKKARTSNGSIEAEIVSSPQHDMHFVTSNGSVELYVADNVNADVVLKTSHGKISIYSSDVTTAEKTKTSFIGSLGKGGHTIDATTSNGSVELHELQ